MVEQWPNLKLWFKMGPQQAKVLTCFQMTKVSHKITNIAIEATFRRCVILVIKVNCVEMASKVLLAPQTNPHFWDTWSKKIWNVNRCSAQMSPKILVTSEPQFSSCKSFSTVAQLDLWWCGYNNVAWMLHGAEEWHSAVFWSKCLSASDVDELLCASPTKCSGIRNVA